MQLLERCLRGHTYCAGALYTRSSVKQAIRSSCPLSDRRETTSWQKSQPISHADRYGDGGEIFICRGEIGIFENQQP